MKGLSPRNRLIAFLSLAGLGLALFFTGEYRDLGLPLGWVGSVLFVAAVWFSVDALHRIPRSDDETVIAPGEWKAWVGLGFMAIAVAYLLARADTFAGASFGSTDAQAVARKLVLLLVAWAVLSQVLALRWKGAVQEDERDREIAAKASGWGRGALVFCIVGYAVMLGFSPPHRMQWATHFMIANMLVFALMWGWLVECAATVAMYWHGRRHASA